MNPDLTPFRRFRIDLAYDGRQFSGWQSQPEGKTVQDALHTAMKLVCPEVSNVQGSGRTDAGVSASQQVAHFDVPGEWKMDARDWRRALNARLPPSIRIFESREVPDSFHSRFSAIGKTYRYQICCGEILPPLQHGLAWHLRNFEGLEALQKGVSLFEGSHDFRSFSAKRNDGKDEARDTRREITEANAVEGPDETILLTFSGNGFLYKMVRFLVGSCVYYAQGKLTLPEISRLLRGENPLEKAPYCAPPDGLSLLAVRYPVEFSLK